jgi:hypothetical protein
MSDAPEIPADRRLLGLGLNECERALLDCWPVVLHKATYSKLFALGIYGEGVNGHGAFDARGVQLIVAQHRSHAASQGERAVVDVPSGEVD